MTLPRALGRDTWSALGLGAMYLAAVGALGAGGPLVQPDERVLGTAAQAVADLVATRYAGEVARIVAGLVAANVVVGAALGLAARAQLALRAHLAKAQASPRPRWRESLLVLLIIAFDHGAAVAWSMSRTPALFAAQFYAAGGVRRAVQVLVTDRAGPTGVLAVGAGVTALIVLGPPTRWPGRLARLGRSVRPSWVVAGVAALLLFGILSTASGRGPTTQPGGRPNVILLASDSLRADRIRREIAPRLSDLSARGASFSRAYVTVPRTFSSWVTILTGRHAHHHGVRSTFARWEDRKGDFDALPARFGRAGYRTAVVSDFAGDIFREVDLGFDRVRAPRTNFREMLHQRGIQRDVAILPFIDTAAGLLAFPAARGLSSLAKPDALADLALRELRGAGSEPFLLTVFFSTTHFPYAAPSPYYRRFADPSYRGPRKYQRDVGLAEDAVTPKVEIQQIRALYDGAVASVDDAVGKILDGLRRDHLDDRTIVVLTSDHGEALFERDNDSGHGDNLFGDEGTHAPLVIYDPRRQARSVPAVVSSVDIAPTLYELAGVPPPSNLDGRSLVPAMDGKELAPAPAFAETELWLVDQPSVPDSVRLPYPHFAGCMEVDAEHGDAIVLRRDVTDVTLVARHRMVRDDRWKLLYLPSRAGVEYRLFDTLADPAEANDVLAKEPGEGSRLQAVLWKWMLEDPRMTRSRGYLLPKRDALDGAVKVVHVRFGGGRKGHRVKGVIHAVRPDQVRLVGLPGDALRSDRGDLVLDANVPAGAVLGVDLDGRTLPLHWEFLRDDAPWPEARVYAGPFGLVASDVRDGVSESCADGFASGRGVPFVVGSKEAGLFVSCDDTDPLALPAPVP